jgi:UPF0716 protein FxsA
MLGKLLLLFVLVPLLELAILVRLGGVLGFWPTIGIVVVTGAVGALLARSQGTRVLSGIRTELAVGQMPTDRLVDGLLILVGGAVLLTPGLLTDVLGLALLIPFTRRRFKAALRRRFDRMIRTGQVNMITLIR